MAKSTYIQDYECICYISQCCWLEATETHSGWMRKAEKKHLLLSYEIVPGLSKMIETRLEKKTRWGKLCHRQTPDKTHHLIHLVGTTSLTHLWKTDATVCPATTDPWTLDSATPATAPSVPLDPLLALPLYVTSSQFKLCSRGIHPVNPRSSACVLAAREAETMSGLFSF